MFSPQRSELPRPFHANLSIGVFLTQFMLMLAIAVLHGHFNRWGRTVVSLLWKLAWHHLAQ